MALRIFFLILALCAYSAIVNSKSFTIQPRIVGGNDAQTHQFPYSVGIFLEQLIVCGGAIIGERHILSSGACGKSLEEKPHEVVAVLGSPEVDNLEDDSPFLMKIDRVYVHPRFREILMKNDLSMLRTARQIIFSETIQPVALPTADLENDEGVMAVVTGWGFLKVRHLKNINKFKILVIVIVNNISATKRAIRYFVTGNVTISTSKDNEVR